MEDQIKKYLKEYFPFDNLFSRRPQRDEELAFNQFKMKRSMRWVMNTLKITPWLCLVGFSFTFGTILLGEGGWIEGITSFWSQNQGIIEALNIISISGLIGYGTNFIAIRMLFRPVQKRPIWGQGLIPAQKDRIIYTLAQGMHKHILSQDLIRKRVEDTGLVRKVNHLVMDGAIGLAQDQRLRDEVKKFLGEVMAEWAQKPQVRKQVVNIVDTHLSDRVGENEFGSFILSTYKRFNRERYEEMILRLTEEIPVVAMRVLDRLEDELDTVAAFLRMHKPTTEEQIMRIFIDLLNRIDITDLLAKQMAHFDEARLEKMIWEATNEQLLYIQYLGTVLGILGGLLIWQPTVMGPSFLLIFGLLYVVDKLLFNWQQKRKQRKENEVAEPELPTQTKAEPAQKKIAAIPVEETLPEEAKQD